MTQYQSLTVQVEGMELVIEDMVGATGLELKSDPGVPFVYAGFAGMMVRLQLGGYSRAWPRLPPSASLLLPLPAHDKQPAMSMHLAE